MKCTGKDSLRLSVSEFQKKAQAFWKIAREQAEFPFEEMFFVATVSAEYELLLQGKRFDGLGVLHLAVSRIMETNPHFSRLKAYISCKKVMTADKGDMFFCWKHYCEGFLQRTDSENPLERGNEMVFQVRKHGKQFITRTVKDFAHVVFLCII